MAVMVRPPTFLAAYAGPSMYPTLREPELLEVVPFTSEGPRVGDVVLFVSRPSDRAPNRSIVHRVSSVTAAGITTRGDHNTHADPSLVQREDIRGRVVGAWRGSRHRRIAGGLRGRWTCCWIRARQATGALARGFLHSTYRTLARGGWLARLVPPSRRPRVVIFRVQGADRRRLLWGRRLIGHYNSHTRRWHIAPPFRVCVDERRLGDHGVKP